MPISRERQKFYPSNWEAISLLTRQRAGWKCELCGAKQRQPHPVTRGFVILTVHHINDDPRDNRRLNLIALCQRCHNRLDQPYRHPPKPEGQLFLKHMSRSDREYLKAKIDLLIHVGKVSREALPDAKRLGLIFSMGCHHPISPQDDAGEADLSDARDSSHPPSIASPGSTWNAPRLSTGPLKAKNRGHR